MRRHGMILVPILAVLVCSCVQYHQRSMRARCYDSNLPEVFSTLDRIIKAEGYYSIGAGRIPTGVFQAHYRRDVGQDKPFLGLTVHLDDQKETGKEEKLFLTLRLLVPGSDEEMKRHVDKDFEDLVTKIEMALKARISIFKIS